MINKFNPYWLPFIGGIIVLALFVYLLLNESFSWEEEVVTLSEKKQNVRFGAEFPTDVHSLEDLSLTFHLMNDNSFPITLSRPIKFKLMDASGETLMEGDMGSQTETIGYHGGFTITIPSPFREGAFQPGKYTVKFSLPKVQIQEQEVDLHLEETNIRVKTTLEEIFG